MNYIILLYQYYTRSERSIASLDTIKRHILYVDHPLDLRCHSLQFVCSLFKVDGEGELIVEVMVEMVGKMVREVVVHLSRHCHHYHKLQYLHPILPYLPFLSITRYFHTPTYLPITRYFYTPIDLHITFHTSIDLHIFTIFGVARASFHGSGYHLIISNFIIPYTASHQ